MPIFYSIRQKRNPSAPMAPMKYYPTIKSVGHITKRKLIEQMVQNTSLTAKEAETGIEYLFAAFPHFLELGYTVQLGDLGYFRMTFHTEGSDTAEEVSASKIKKVNLRFVCGADMRESIQRFPIEKFPEPDNAV